MSRRTPARLVLLLVTGGLVAAGAAAGPGASASGVPTGCTWVITACVENAVHHLPVTAAK